MYNEYFGFRESPFSIAPDPRYLYMTAQHREALAHLVYGLNSDGGCILLTGEVGTGKTTICRCLLEQVPEQAKVALVLNPKVSEIELLETICDELHISYPDSDNSVKTYTDRIYRFLIESNRENRKTVLIIDEAQNLDGKVLEQLRLLTNLETNQRKLLQIIILGQPELLDILATTEMRQLSQRITARFHLKPLDKPELKAYINHRLAVAGQNIQLLPEDSIKLLYKLSNGVPRLINIICDRALLGAYVENQHVVSTSIIKKAATEVFGELKNVENQKKNKRWIYPVLAFAGFLIFAVALVLFLAKSPVSEKPQPAASLPITGSPPQAELAEADNRPDQETPADITQATLAAETATTGDSNNLETPLTTSTGNLPATEQQTEYENLDDILNTSTASQVSAYQQLFNTWNISYNKNIPTTACKQASLHSLSCLHKQGNLNSLKVHNRPAVLTLVNSKGESRYATITAINNERATIFTDNTEHIVKLSDLDKHWYGQFSLLWKKPDHYSSAITPGDKGPVINWLSTRLAEIDNTTSGNRNLYDKELSARVKQFQLQHGLTADGIVGPMTIIQINTRSETGVPVLSEQT